MKATKKAVVITGVDTGIGFHLCLLFAEAEYTVIGSVLGETPFKKKTNITTIKMDLRIEEEIRSFAGKVKKILLPEMPLAGLINNAGTVLAGPVENLPVAAFREVFEVNFFGLIALTRQLIPLLAESKGIIMNNGSLAGKAALPYFAPYASSKFALEGFTDSLRRELAPRKIRTVLLEPGGIATPIWNNSWNTIKTRYLDRISETYKSTFIKAAEGFVANGNKGMAPEKAAEQIFKIFHKKRPKPRYIIAKDRFISTLITHLPQKWLDSIMAGMFGIE